MAKQHIHILKKVIASLTVVTTILSVSGLTLFVKPGIVLAHPGPPSITHMALSMADGEGAGTNTTLEFFVGANDDTATPTTTPRLGVYANYKINGGDSYSSTTCYSVDSTSLHRCLLENAVTGSSTDPRIFYYYLEAGDGNASSCISYATTSYCSGEPGQDAQTFPFQISVQNNPLCWNNEISGQYVTSTSKQWPGVKDSRCFRLTVGAPVATTTIYLASTTENITTFETTSASTTWILITGYDRDTSEKFRVEATSTVNRYGSDQLMLTLSGATTHQANVEGTCVTKFLGGATVWVPGLGGPNHHATSSTENATSTYGTFILRDIPNGTWELAGAKSGYSMGRVTNLSIYGQSTSTIDLYLPYGQFSGGGDQTGAFVMWSAPMNGTMNAPTNIALSQTSFPMMIGFPKNLSWATLSTSTVWLQSVAADGTMTTVSGYQVGYQAQGGNVIDADGQDTGYSFGPDAKIIVYSSTNLTTSTDYVLRITSSVKDTNGNAVSGNDPAGGHTIFFSTGVEMTGMITSGNFGTGGNYMPPFVMNVWPGFGNVNVARNAKIAIEFNQAMDPSSISSSYVQVWQLDSNYSEVSQVTMASYALDTANKGLVIITPPAAGLAANTIYRVKILGGVQTASGIKMAPPGSEGMKMFSSEFTTGVDSDVLAPTVQGTTLDRYLSAGVYSGVPISGAFKVAISEALDPGSVNTNNIYLQRKGSTTKVTSIAEFDFMEGKLLFVPSAALSATTTYVLTFNTQVTDFTTTSNAMATTTYEFTTGGVDETAPFLDYINADDFTLSITFDEAMNAVNVSDTTEWPSGVSKWRSSVLNPKNYVLYVDQGAASTGANAALYFGCENLAGTTTGCNTEGTSGLNFTYDAVYKTVEVGGLKLGHPSVGLTGVTGVRVFVNSVTDLSGNAIDVSGSTPPGILGSNAKEGPFFRSQDTFGMMGPGGGMFTPPSTAGQFTVTDFGGKDPARMGMMPVGVWPMNMVAGATSIYMIDIPISLGKAIPSGGKVVIGPFPDEANVAGVKDADPNKTFAHYDLNGSGPGQPQIASLSTSSQTITITTGNADTYAPDFIHLELDGIVNPTSPSSGGYKISIQTQDDSGRQLESFTSMPFFLMPKGKYYIVGHATSTTAGEDALNGIKIFGGSPSTGPLFTTTANNAFGSSTVGEFQIDGLNSGDVMLMTEPYIEVGGSEYISPMSEPIFLSDNTTANTPGAAMAGDTGCTSNSACYYYKRFNLTKVVAGGATPDLTVYIYGDFSASGVGQTEMDIFAGGPQGYRVKTVTLNANHTTTPSKNTLYLPITGDYHVGIGPAMPKGPMGMAGAVMPDDWMPPEDKFVSVSGSAGNWTWDEDSATSSDDGLVSFTIQRADKTISGHVYDASGVAVPNAEVFAYSPTEFFGNSTHVRQDGSFTLNVRDGFYKVGAFLPGAPPSGEVGVEVKFDGTVYVGGALTTNVKLYISKTITSGTTISGTVYSDVSSQYPATDASVYAYRTDGPGHAETMTDSKGSYTLYVSPGTWNVGAYLPTHGDLGEKTITVPPSKSGLNFAPSANISYVTIRQRVCADADADGCDSADPGVARAAVSVTASTTDYVNNAVTDSDGVFEVKVPGDASGVFYDIEVWSPDLGNLATVANVQATTNDIIYTDFPLYGDVAVTPTTTVSVGFYDSDGNATSVDKVLVQLDQTSAKGISNDSYKEAVATTTLIVSTSTNPYLLDIEIKGIPKELLNIKALGASTSVGSTTVHTMVFSTTTVDSANETIQIILPRLCHISGQVMDTANATSVPNTVIHVEQPGKDIEFDVEADADGNFSFKVASSSEPYIIQADKGGYIDLGVSVYASTSSYTFNPSVEKSGYSISGTIQVSGGSPGDSYVWAEKLGGGAVTAATTVDSTSGAYNLNVTSGEWEVHAVADGYNAQEQTAVVHIADTAGANQDGVDFNLSVSKTLQKTETLGMAGNVGGRLVNKDAGFEMNVPRATISATDSSSYNVKEKEISNVPTFSPTSNLVGDKAEELSAYKMSGSNGNVSTVSDLNGSAFVDKTYTKAELAVENINNVSEIEQTKMAHFDDSAQNWTNVPTTITYLDSSDYPVIPAEDLSNVEKVIFNGVIKHFSKLGVVNTTYDSLPPLAPAGVNVTAEGGSLKIAWTAVTQNTDGTAAHDIQRYNIFRGEGNVWTKLASVATTTTSYYDNTVSAGTTYRYKVTADTGVQSGYSNEASGQAVSTTAGGAAPAAAAPAVEEVAEEEAAPTEIAMAEEEEAAPAAEAEEVPAAEVVEIPTVTFEKPIAEMSAAEIQAKITEVLEVIATLKAMVEELQAAQAALAVIPSDYTFETTLQYGQSSKDVEYLQQFLKAQGADIYPEGLVTGYFGSLTKAAVIRFQEAHAKDILQPWELSQGTGLVGSTTRAKLNELLGR